MDDKHRFDYTKMNKDLSDRQQIIDEFNRTRYLDRSKAISLIQSLRLEDADVMQITAAVQIASGTTAWDRATDDQIAGELIMQINILRAKIEKTMIQNTL